MTERLILVAFVAISLLSLSASQGQSPSTRPTTKPLEEMSREELIAEVEHARGDARMWRQIAEKSADHVRAFANSLARAQNQLEEMQKKINQQQDQVQVH